MSTNIFTAELNSWRKPCLPTTTPLHNIASIMQKTLQRPAVMQSPQNAARTPKGTADPQMKGILGTPTSG